MKKSEILENLYYVNTGHFHINHYISTYYMYNLHLFPNKEVVYSISYKYEGLHVK